MANRNGDLSIPTAERVRQSYVRKANKKYTPEQERLNARRRKASKKYYITLKGRAYALRRAAKSRAKLRGYEFDLEQKWILEKLEKGTCEVTGIPFVFITAETYGNGENSAQPFSPSLDRIDNTRGYTMDNVQVVVNGFNIAKSHWPVETYEKIAEAYFNFKGKRNESV